MLRARCRTLCSRPTRVSGCPLPHWWVRVYVGGWGGGGGGLAVCRGVGLHGALAGAQGAVQVQVQGRGGEGRVHRPVVSDACWSDGPCRAGAHQRAAAEGNEADEQCQDAAEPGRVPGGFKRARGGAAAVGWLFGQQQSAWWV